jgi:hypothetical protein
MKGYLRHGIVAHVQRYGNCTMVLLKALVPVGKLRVEASAWGGCHPDPGAVERHQSIMDISA